MLIRGDAREIPLRDGCVHTVVTSPPYFGLRDYGTGTWVGGDAACKHAVGGQVEDTKAPGAIETGQRPGVDASRCKKCGAERRDIQIGLEQTPEAYIAAMVGVFREVHRVLRDDGTLWINIGDSYSNDDKWGGATGGKHVQGLHGSAAIGRARKTTGLKPKDLIGIPWMLAFALRADGWFLRSDIIWHKPNPMPESVEDRPTKAHEYLFLLSKQERYFYDAEAIKEASSDPVGSAERYKSSFGGAKNEHLLATDQVHTRPIGMWEFDGSRNRRSVWRIPTKPYKGSHFATFPEALVQPCILAGTSMKGCCPDCGAGWVRITEKTLGGEKKIQEGPRPAADERGVSSTSGLRTNGRTTWNVETTGWRPTCACGNEATVPCVVFDPFVGSGTSVRVATSLGRLGVGLDASQDYLSRLARRRATVTIGMGI